MQTNPLSGSVPRSRTKPQIVRQPADEQSSPYSYVLPTPWALPAMPNNSSCGRLGPKGSSSKCAWLYIPVSPSYESMTTTGP